MKFQYIACQLQIKPETIAEAIQIGEFVGNLPPALRDYVGIDGTWSHLWVGVDQLRAVDQALDWHSAGLGRVGRIKQLLEAEAELERRKLADMARPPIMPVVQDRDFAHSPES